MRVIIAETAESDLEAIGDYIALDNPARAITFVRELRAKCLELARMPQRFPILPHRPQSGIRRRVVGNYLILFQIGGDAVDVLHILNGAMDYERIMFPDE
jgi:plasmid stabilization system protein ParE